MPDGGYSLLSLPFSLLVAIPLWRIYQRAGLNPALSLIGLIPVVGFIIAVAILAWSTWPNVPLGAGFRRVR